MPDNDLVELDLDKLESRGINRYQAVLLASQEARFINDQIRLDITKSSEKPSTTALKKLFDGRVVANTENEEKEE